MTIQNKYLLGMHIL